jgi:hypothetical protein
MGGPTEQQEDQGGAGFQGGAQLAEVLHAVVVKDWRAWQMWSSSFLLFFGRVETGWARIRSLNERGVESYG